MLATCMNALALQESYEELAIPTRVQILQVINYALYYLGVNAYLQYIIKGLIIILAVSIDVRKYLKKK